MTDLQERVAEAYTNAAAIGFSDEKCWDTVIAVILSELTSERVVNEVAFTLNSFKARERYESEDPAAYAEMLAKMKAHALVSVAGAVLRGSDV